MNLPFRIQACLPFRSRNCWFRAGRRRWAIRCLGAVRVNSLAPGSTTFLSGLPALHLSRLSRRDRRKRLPSRHRPKSNAAR